MTTDARHLNLPPTGDGGVADPFAEPPRTRKPRVRVDGAPRATITAALDAPPDATEGRMSRAVELSGRLRARGVLATVVPADGGRWRIKCPSDQGHAAASALAEIRREDREARR